MFMIRTVFWLSLVVLILPTDERQQERLTARIADTVGHAATFCERNQRACENAAHYWELFRQKADYGVQLAYGLIARQFGAADNRHDRRGVAYERTYPHPPISGTLRPADLAPAWRGKPSDSDI